MRLLYNHFSLIDLRSMQVGLCVKYFLASTKEVKTKAELARCSVQLIPLNLKCAYQSSLL